MDDMTPPSKFDEFTWPTSDFIGPFVFYRPAFLAFYRLFCKIANLWDMDLKISLFISHVNSDNPAKFREVSMPRNCLSKNRICSCISSKTTYSSTWILLTWPEELGQCSIVKICDTLGVSGFVSFFGGRNCGGLIHENFLGIFYRPIWFSNQAFTLSRLTRKTCNLMGSFIEVLR